MDTVEIIGRSSSHFTRMARVFAEELSVPYRLVPVPDMTVLSDKLYGGNPAMKLPVLRVGTLTLFGAENICRAITERSNRAAQIVWPENLREPLSYEMSKNEFPDIPETTIGGLQRAIAASGPSNTVPAARLLVGRLSVDLNVAPPADQRRLHTGCSVPSAL
jgi:hypothetical protein